MSASLVYFLKIPSGCFSQKTSSRFFSTFIRERNNIMKAHTKCINNIYPDSEVQRQHVPADKVFWSNNYPLYSPPSYSSPTLLGKAWADPDLLESLQMSDSIAWNQMDQTNNVDRTSHHGSYLIENLLPRNPLGRTGLRGRGLLGRWGPNHAADPIVTRWLRDQQGAKVIDSVSGKAHLQFVAIKRKDSGEWALPGGMVDPGEQVSQTLKREFAEETLDGVEYKNAKLEEAFKHPVEIYKGYVDDPRNTDNSWMETVACNFHDEDGNLFNFKYVAGSDASKVQWMDLNRSIKLYASHQDFIHNVATLRNAHW